MIHITEQKLRAAIQISLGADGIYTKDREDKLVHNIKALSIADVVGQSEQCCGCDESTGETKLWCCNHCGKRIQNF